MRAAQLHERLQRGRIQGAVHSLVRARPALQRAKAAALVSIIPLLDRARGEKPPVPGLFGGLGEGLNKGNSTLACLHDHLHGGKTSQGAGLPEVFVGEGSVFHRTDCSAASAPRGR